MARDQQRSDIYREVTNHIISAISTAGSFELPWRRLGGHRISRPSNVATRKQYNGINTVSLWVAAMAHAFTADVWGTYRQWQALGCQVRKGEKSSVVVFFSRIEAQDNDDDTDDSRPNTTRLVARASRVFNADQVDGYINQIDNKASQFDPLQSAERFVRATDATIVEGGDSACYIPERDIIRMPQRQLFVGTDTSSAAEGYYGTLLHELVHWSGAQSRLSRDMASRFGSESYAMEELVAELGSAFLCADLGISSEPRADHACYVKNWLAVLRGDKRAIFTAAAKASQAADFLKAFEAGS